jgi:hypothetical protein
VLCDQSDDLVAVVAPGKGDACGKRQRWGDHLVRPEIACRFANIADLLRSQNVRHPQMGDSTAVGNRRLIAPQEQDDVRR